MRTVKEGRGQWRREGGGGKRTVEERRGGGGRGRKGTVEDEGRWKRRGDGVGTDGGGGGTDSEGGDRDGGGGGRDQGCIFSPKDESRGVEEIMGTFEEPKGGPLDIGEEY